MEGAGDTCGIKDQTNPMNQSDAKVQLEKLKDLDNNLIDVLVKTADILDSITSLSSASSAQALVKQKPEEFHKLLQDIRNGFFEVIETAPKPGIPYYDPKPLADKLDKILREKGEDMDNVNMK